MVRMQVYLTERQRRALEKKARASGEPVAALIRRAVDLLLGGEQRANPDEILAATLGALPDLDVPERGEWERAAETPAPYG